MYTTTANARTNTTSTVGWRHVLEYESLDGVLFHAHAPVRMQLKYSRVTFEELNEIFAREPDHVAHLIGRARYQARYGLQEHATVLVQDSHDVVDRAHFDRRQAGFSAPGNTHTGRGHTRAETRVGRIGERTERPVASSAAAQHGTHQRLARMNERRGERVATANERGGSRQDARAVAVARARHGRLERVRASEHTGRGYVGQDASAANLRLRRHEATVDQRGGGQETSFGRRRWRRKRLCRYVCTAYLNSKII